MRWAVPSGRNSSRRVELLAGADELDRLAGDHLGAEQRAAAGVGVELGQDQPVDLELFVEGLGAVDGVLAAHRVEDEEDLVRLELGVDLAQLAHQRVVDVEPAGGVEDDHVPPGLLGLGDRRPADGHRRPAGDLPVRGGLGQVGVDGHADLLAERLELFDGGRSLQVGRGQHRVVALGDQHLRELAAGGRFARPLQAAHHDDRRRRLDEVDPGVHRAHQADQFLVDDLDHRLAGAEGLDHLAADRLLEDVLGELAHDLEVDVGIEEEIADLLHRLADVLFTDPAAPGEAPEHAAELVGQVVEHGSVSKRERASSDEACRRLNRTAGLGASRMEAQRPIIGERGRG